MASLNTALRSLMKTFDVARGGIAKGGVRSLPVSYRTAFMRTFTRTSQRSLKFDAKLSAKSTARHYNSTFFTRNSKPTERTLLQQWRARFFHTTRARRSIPEAKSSTTPRDIPMPKEPENLSMTQRLKKLSREYGWSAVGVYLLLTAVDFPFCYLLVRYLGTDKIGEWEHLIVSNFQKLVPPVIQAKWHEWRAAVKESEVEISGDNEVSEHIEMVGWGVEEAQKENRNHASLATQLALAYAIHKSFIFIRVPLTAALTPKVVHILRGWGWDIGRKTTKAARAAKRAEISSSKA